MAAPGGGGGPRQDAPPHLIPQEAGGLTLVLQATDPIGGGGGGPRRLAPRRILLPTFALADPDAAVAAFAGKVWDSLRLKEVPKPKLPLPEEGVNPTVDKPPLNGLPQIQLTAIKITSQRGSMLQPSSRKGSFLAASSSNSTPSRTPSRSRRSSFVVPSTSLEQKQSSISSNGDTTLISPGAAKMSFTPTKIALELQKQALEAEAQKLMDQWREGRLIYIDHSRGGLERVFDLLID